MIQRYTHPDNIFQAVQVKESDFSEPHPNPNDLPGVIYNPKNKTAWVCTNPGLLMSGQAAARVGDWILKGVDGSFHVLTNLDPHLMVKVSDEHEADDAKRYRWLKSQLDKGLEIAVSGSSADFQAMIDDSME